MEPQTNVRNSGNALTISASLSEHELKQGVVRFWTQAYLGPIVLTAVLVAFAAAMTWLRTPPIFRAVVWTAATIMTLQHTVAFLCFRRRSIVFFRELEGTSVTHTFSDVGVGTASALGESMLRWRMFARVWKSRDMWLLATRNMNVIVLPARYLSKEIKTAINDGMRMRVGKRIV